MINTTFDILTLFCCIILIIGLRYLSHPETARKGNIFASVGVCLGILLSVLYPLGNAHNNYTFILIGLIIGGIIGLISAKKVPMTSMPEMVSLFNGFGGLCAIIISILWVYFNVKINASVTDKSTVLLNMLIGSVAFTGSMLAYGKLSGKIKDKHVNIPFSSILNIAILIVLISFVIKLSFFNFDNNLYIIFIVLSLIYGFTFVAPIGGADMPVVISLLNSLTGVTAAISGIITDDKLMLLGGILVGSSGTILTILMCKAMNRSLLNVIIGSFGAGTKSSTSDTGNQIIKEISYSDLAIMMAYSNKVAIVPGYGMAVSQAQKTCKDLESILSNKDVEVKYAIHPVAGRMPGHMNVLLAEADVDYSNLLDLDDANTFFDDCDVTLIVGANDVVNPAAKEDPSSNIYGMPILEAYKSKNVVILKRSMNTGYAGIQNPLFFKENSKMLFGDAKKSLMSIINEIKNI